ncbi:MAG: peptide ABC transporter substrate-binding protein [Deltaproteobacteria bacterium]|nr:peptide ABC transporter substrate-binding protein [Deltaproteobacteria bacterium]
MKLTTRRILILVPLFVTLFLVQSYFWVPGYEQQATGNPERLGEYISASIGDASILNPILSSDSASSAVESMVFEGLIDRDENLNFRGRLAISWKIYEEAFFYINKEADIPGLGKAGPEEMLRYLLGVKERQIPIDERIRPSIDNIMEITVIPPEDFIVSRPEEGPAGKDVRLLVRAPARIKLTLERVDQDVFTGLTLLLGQDYFYSFPSKAFVGIRDEEESSKLTEESKNKILARYAEQILPATEHNPVISFQLRPGVTFHDGQNFDAEDVKFTYDAIMNPRNLSPRIADYEPVKHVEVIDPLTVRIVYKRLYSPAIGTWSIPIIPEHLLNDEALRGEATQRGMDPDRFTMRHSLFNRRPVGCGPFIFREWKSDQYIALDRFEGYWEGPPNYRRYFYRIVPDLLTQEMEFYAGTVDTYHVQPHQVTRLSSNPNYQSFSGLSFGYTYIGYNMRRPPFDDRRVRLALGMAVDVEKIMRYVLYGQGERITGPFVKQTDFYNHDVRPLPYDPERALRLLSEAGWQRNKRGWLEKEGKRLQFTLITNSGNDTRKAVVAIVQDAWRQIGIDVRTDLIEWSVFVQERVNKADFDALVLGWQMGIEPDLYQIWHSSQSHPHQLNFVGFRNEQADDMIIRIRQEYDHRRQVEDCHRFHELIAREQPYTFLYVGKWTAVLDKRIVIKDVDEQGRVTYNKIAPTKTGNFTFYFNKWIKLREAPSFAAEG